jgi:hypothetical protein
MNVKNSTRILAAAAMAACVAPAFADRDGPARYEVRRADNGVRHEAPWQTVRPFDRRASRYAVDRMSVERPMVVQRHVAHEVIVSRPVYVAPPAVVGRPVYVEPPRPFYGQAPVYAEPYPVAGYARSSVAGTLGGALIGAIIGNQVANPYDRAAATVAGAVIGGVIGSNF